MSERLKPVQRSAGKAIRSLAGELPLRLSNGGEEIDISDGEDEEEEDGIRETRGMGTASATEFLRLQDRDKMAKDMTV
jgi:hypothetical protein